jgi:3-methylcrotonyl-CoA carboxylase alpha subunit
MKLVTEQQTIEVEIVARRPCMSLAVDGQHYQIHETVHDDGSVDIEVNGQCFKLWRAVEGERVQIKLGARLYSIEVEDPVVAAASAGGAGNELTADMPGVVVALRCAANDTVVAPRTGVVETVHVALNESFQKGAHLITLAKEDAT